MRRRQICKILYMLTVIVFISVNTLSVFAVVNHIYSCIACVVQETVDCSEFAKLTEDSQRFCLMCCLIVSNSFKMSATSDIAIYSCEFKAITPVACKVKMNN